MIKKLVYAVLLSFALLVPASTPALANGCSGKARAFVADKPRTTLIAVKAQKQRNGSVICVARVRIAQKNGKPPRIVVRKFRP